MRRTVPPPASKIIITGTGRAGTTFLVQLLTELGLDTGYSRENWQRDYDAHCAAGLEHDPAAGDSPRIVKNPALCETLPGLLARGEIRVEHAIVPVRALDEAACSRIRVGGHGDTPGGLWGTANAAEQKAVLAVNFHRLVHTLVAHEIPHTFLAFPRFVRDPDYTWMKLRGLLVGVNGKDFLVAFARVSRPELIHDFAGGIPDEAGAPARAYAHQQRDRRRRRRIRRVLAWVSVAVAIGTLAVFRPGNGGAKPGDDSPPTGRP